MRFTDTGLWGGKIFWENSFFAREKLGGRVIARIMLLLLLLAALCTLANANGIHVTDDIFEQPSYLFCYC